MVGCYTGSSFQRQNHIYQKSDFFLSRIHGVEVYNAGNYNEENERAYMYAKQYNLPITAGGDSHHHDITCSGIGVEERFESIVDYIKCIKENKPKQLLYIN